MATIQITVNDAFVPRILAAFTARYPAIVAGLPQGQAAKAVIIQLVKEVVIAYEAQKATDNLAAQINNLGTQWQTTNDAQTAQTGTDVQTNVS